MIREKTSVSVRLCLLSHLPHSPNWEGGRSAGLADGRRRS